MALNGKKFKKFVKSTYKKGKQAYSKYQEGAEERAEEKLAKFKLKRGRQQQREEAKLRVLQTKGEIASVKAEMREAQVAPYREKFQKLEKLSKEKFQQLKSSATGQEELEEIEGGGSPPPQMMRPSPELKRTKAESLSREHFKSKEPSDPLGLNLNIGPSPRISNQNPLGGYFGEQKLSKPVKNPLGFSFGSSKNTSASDMLGITLGRREKRNVRRAEKKYYKRTKRPQMSMEKFLGLK